MKYIKQFSEISIKDITLVGGKNASLGEMITQLASKGIRIPDGFAITADAYWYYVEYNKLIEPMKTMMSQLDDTADMKLLHHVGSSIRRMLASGVVPDDLAQEIIEAYHALSTEYKGDNCDVAVRSSATAEDLPTASFAGQQDTFLNISGDEQLLECYKKGVASLFTDRAIIYRIDQDFDHFKVALSVGVQKMIRSDKAVSGVAFSLDTESGFKDVVTIESSYGLGETIVQGLVTPDEFVVHKPTLAQGFRPIIKKVCGDKKMKLVYANNGKSVTKTVVVSKDEQKQFSLTDDEILQLAKYVVIIENHYSELKKAWSPMDVEWAKDGDDGLLYIIQARPETICMGKQISLLKTYALDKNDPEIIISGLSIGQKIVSGTARFVSSVKDISKIQEGDILVTTMTDPDWVPVMKRAAGIITDQGGRTCHAAIVSRELGIPAIVGTKNGTKAIKNGIHITLDCSRGMQGYVYKGIIPFTIHETALDTIKEPPVNIMVNCADPASAFQTSFLPVCAVGLARIEFIISSMIRIHPMALLFPAKVKSAHVRTMIDDITHLYKNKEQFFIEMLAQGVGTIAAAFYPRPVIVRFSDFKTNEYRNLIGGEYFEPKEENPMIGFRGASRYYHEQYKQSFALECAAMKYTRDVMGLNNIKLMIPFVRTVDEAQKVIAEMESNGLVRGEKNLEYIMMCEVPSNVILIEEFSRFFDGFSIGSNDLTQLILGIDRDAESVSSLFDETNDAVKKAMIMAIEGAHKHGRHIGICGQAPSDHPEIADFLIKNKIDSLSLNADSIISFLMR